MSIIIVLIISVISFNVEAFEFRFTQETDLPSPSPTFFENKNSCPKSFSEIKGVEYYDIDNPVKDVSSTDFSALTKLEDDIDRNSLLKAISENIEYWEVKPESFYAKIGKDSYSKSKMLKANKRLYEIFSSSMSLSEILNVLKKEFNIYKAVSDETNDVTITGYYESEIAVKREKDDIYKYPLHLKPPDLVKVNGMDFDYGRYDENGNLVKYYSTEEIRKGEIDKFNIEIAYSNHPAEIMLAQIQGSSILRFLDGDYARIGFDGANGWKFVSVQKILMDCGEIPSMNFKSFIKYLSSQPQDREERLVNLNPRYIFFTIKDKDSSPQGAISKDLVSGRSVAIDPAYIPYGFVAYISSTKPVSDENGETIIEFKRFSRFIVTHDTGSAIRGAGRIDLFWGSGKKAELEASSMKANGSFYIFAPKN
ncbi:MAG: MltA domain-containing protein [Elusimicrobiota bacterium]